MSVTLWLRSIGGQTKGQFWELRQASRVGRMDHLEVILDEPSVSRNHAELVPVRAGWRIRDLESTNGTFLNGTRMGPGQWPLRVRDLLQFGDVALLVEGIDTLLAPEGTEHRPGGAGAGQDDLPREEPGGQTGSFHQEPMTSFEELSVEAASGSSWNDALISPIGKKSSDDGEGSSSLALLALLQSSRHLMFVEREEDLLRSILEEAVKVLDAQRGAIVLVVPSGALAVRAVVEGRHFTSSATGFSSGPHTFSKSLAERVFAGRQSVLCQRLEGGAELAAAPSIVGGDMASVICALLRTPRRVLGVLHLDRSCLQKPFTRVQLDLADALAAQVSAGIETAQLLRKQREMFQETITVLGQVLELRDEYTGGHTRRVTRYAVTLAEAMCVHPDEVEWLRLGAPLHDIGKIGIADEILRKTGPLSAGEMAAMRQHATLGADILASIPSLAKTAAIARSHHEWWDGTGYPDGLAGTEIPLLARILALADVFDALTSHRPYRSPLNLTEALVCMEQLSGRQFDPALFTQFKAVASLLPEKA